MFRKRTKKFYPPGTFISTPARVAAILQLCLAFTIVLWYASQPFLGDLFAIRSKMVVYDYVMIQHRTQFNQLPLSQQDRITEEYAALHHQLQTPFLEKLKHTFTDLLGIPPFELAWLCLSIVVPIMLLKRLEGAVQAVWLLPLLAAAYAVDNRLHAIPLSPSAEEKLFPSEATLVAHYLQEPFSKNIFEQREQLKKSWETYLIDQWSGEIHTLEQGEFAFHVARLEAMKTEKASRHQEGLILLAGYLFWNLSIALLAQAAVNQVQADPSKIFTRNAGL